MPEYFLKNPINNKVKNSVWKSCLFGKYKMWLIVSVEPLRTNDNL